MNANWPHQPVTVRVPASSANLGPGFDSLGLALGLHDIVQARVTGGGLTIKVSGTGQQTARFGEEHLVVRAMRAAFDVAGEQPPGLALHCKNAIPQGFGLGSSAAAIVAGLLAARALCAAAAVLSSDSAGPLTDEQVFQLAAGLEGHADNVAAALFGGLTIVWSESAEYRPAPARLESAEPGPALLESARYRSVRLEPLASLTPVLCVPAVPLATVTARRVLPATVPHADAAQNAARAALLIAALTSDPAPLLDATKDFLHQPYRAEVMPRSAALITDLRESGIPAVISGAGPSVLALTVAGLTAGAAAVAVIAADSGPGWTVSPLPVDVAGAALVQPCK